MHTENEIFILYLFYEFVIVGIINLNTEGETERNENPRINLLESLHSFTF